MVLCWFCNFLSSFIITIIYKIIIIKLNEMNNLNMYDDKRNSKDRSEILIRTYIAK
jgi:hypothetical protein